MATENSNVMQKYLHPSATKCCITAHESFSQNNETDHNFTIDFGPLPTVSNTH